MEKETFTCSICKKEKNIDARENHHVNSTEVIPVCRSCHKKIHVNLRKERMLARSKLTFNANKIKVKVSDVKILYAVAKLVKKHPELKYRAIAEMLGTTVNMVKVSVYRARKRGLLPERETSP